MKEVEREGGRVPPLGDMEEEEYAEWVRDGMYRLRHQAEVEARERARWSREAAEKLRVRERERAGEEEAKRIKRLEARKGIAEEGRRRKERVRYRSRWLGITDVGGEIEATELAHEDRS